MGYPKEKILVLNPDVGNGFDIGNTANSVAKFFIPVRCSVLQAQAYSNTAVANSFTVTFGATNTATDSGSIIIPDSAAANAVYVDTLAVANPLAAGATVLVCVTEAGDSGEKGFVKLIVEYEPEVVGNSPLLTESA